MSHLETLLHVAPLVALVTVGGMFVLLSADRFFMRRRLDSRDDRRENDLR